LEIGWFAVTNIFDVHPQVISTAENVNEAVRELPDANLVMP